MDEWHLSDKYSYYDRIEFGKKYLQNMNVNNREHHQQKEEMKFENEKIECINNNINETEIENMDNKMINQTIHQLFVNQWFAKSNEIQQILKQQKCNQQSKSIIKKVLGFSNKHVLKQDVWVIIIYAF